MSIVSTTIECIFKCDGCLLETTAAVNPYFHVDVSLGTMPHVEASPIDLCQDCIAMITVPSVVDYVASLSIAP